MQAQSIGLESATHAALRDWRKGELPESPFRATGLYQRYEEAQRGATPHDITKTLLHDALVLFERESPEAALLLRERFQLGLTIRELARQRHQGQSTLHKVQRMAIRALAAVLERLDHTTPRRLDPRITARLPDPTYSRLVGVDASLDTLGAHLAAFAPPWLITLVGIGGIGKTSLADALTRRVLELGSFEAVVWVSAQQVVFSLTGELQPRGRPALTIEGLVMAVYDQIEGTDRQMVPLEEAKRQVAARLKARRTLVVVDNLETIPDVARLVPLLSEWVNPGKVLMTSRVHDMALVDLYPHVVPELSRADAYHLLRNEAHQRNFEALTSREALLARIYAVVGGNPLALRLLVGQAYLYGVDAVLRDIEASRYTGERLYAYIYEYAWRQLSPAARDVLLAMPLLPDTGGALEMLFHIVDLPPDLVRSEVATLAAQNLITVLGSAEKRYYSVHNLTRAFLKEAIAKWT